jgi:transposase
MTSALAATPSAPTIGIDVSKATLDVVLLTGAQRHHWTLTNDPSGWTELQRRLDRQQAMQAPVCLEATGRYSEGVAEALYRAGSPVAVVNPARVKAFADSRLSRTKTDKADATLLAEFARLQPTRLWSPPDPAQRELRELVRRLDDLQAMRQQEHNRRLAGRHCASVQASLDAVLAVLDDQLKALKRQIQQHIDAHPALQRQRALLVSIPGIGVLTAARLLAELGDVSTFHSAGQLAAFAGLVPSQHQSGASVHRPARLNKHGSVPLRTALYFPAIVAQKHNPILAAFSQRLRAKGLAPKAVIAASMRKLLHLVFGILKHGRPFDPHYLDPKPRPS